MVISPSGKHSFERLKINADMFMLLKVLMLVLEPQPIHNLEFYLHNEGEGCVILSFLCSSISLLSLLFAKLACFELIVRRHISESLITARGANRSTSLPNLLPYSGPCVPKKNVNKCIGFKYCINGGIIVTSGQWPT